jgi:hypothetical protein
MIDRMSRSYRRRTMASIVAATALLLAIAPLPPGPAPSTLARTGSINIGTRPPS